MELIRNYATFLHFIKINYKYLYILTHFQNQNNLIINMFILNFI